MAKSSWHVFRTTDGQEPFKRTGADKTIVNRRFRFDLAAGMAFEDEVGEGINSLLRSGRTTFALVKGLLYGFRWEDPKLTERDVKAALQLFIDADGDITDIYDQVVAAINASGTYGKVKAPAPVEDPPEAGAEDSGGASGGSVAAPTPV